MTFLVKLHKTNKMPKSTIKGLGFYVPENIVTNHDLTKIMDTSDEWIKERTGIKERRWVNDDKLSTSLMGTYAAEKAISDSGLDKNDIDFANKPDENWITTVVNVSFGEGDSETNLQRVLDHVGE